jgi:hypothetical protein
MWQEQLISIVEGNSLDPDHIADLLVTYEAETGDASLRDCGEVLMFMGALRPWPTSVSGLGFLSGSESRSKSGSVYKSRSKSESGFMSMSGSGSGSWSWSWSRSGFRSESRSGSRSGSGSK